MHQLSLHWQPAWMMLAFTLWNLSVLSFFLPRCDASFVVDRSSCLLRTDLPVVRLDHNRHYECAQPPLNFWRRAPDDVDLDESMILSQNIIAFYDDAATGSNISMHATISTDDTNSIIEPITNDHSCWFDGKNNRRLRFSSMIVGLIFVPPLFMRLLIPGSKSGSDESSNRMLLQYDDYTNNNASLDRRMNGLQQEKQPEMIANAVANVETSKVVLNGHNSTMVQNSFVNNTHFPMEADSYTHFALLESSQYSASSPMTDGGILKRFVRRYFQNNAGNMNETIILVKPKLSKEELDCPIVVTNIDELQNAVFIKKIPLRDVSFRFPTNGIGYDDLIRGPNDTMPNSGKQQQQRGTMFSRHDPAINGTLSSLLTYEAKTSSNPILRANYQHGIDLLSHHPVLSVVAERVKSKSKPGRRLKSSSSDGAHLALVIEGGGMRGAVSAGMAAALSTLDMLDAFDSIHGSSAGAIVGAYLVSRQLCTDVYTDIMPAAGSRFASKRMGVVNFGVDWLDDVIQRKFLSTSSEDGEEKSDEGAVCDDDNDGNATSLYCDDEDNLSSVEMAMNDQPSSRRPRVWHDDPNDGLVLESASYIFSKATGPLLSGVRGVGSVLRPALSAIDFASSMRQYLKRRPGMNLTYILDGVMEETGLRPFDLDAFRSNDKRQPLYVISSTVTNGGKGSMETVAFNSKDGDFFGIIEDDTKLTISENSGSWYGKIWAIVKFVPYTLLSGARRLLFADRVLSQPINDEVEAAALPSGTSAMYGFANRRRIRQLSRPQAENKYDPTGCVNDEGKNGLFPCLEASMLVPGIAGPPIQLIRSKNRKFVEQSSRLSRFLARRELNRRKSSDSHVCFDAFCYEPIPYRSAVEKAKATHVLALRTRPDGCIVETRQHLYERVVAPLYFRKHGLGQVAKLFASGKSQYRYIEDVLTLNAGLAHGIEIGKQNQSSSSHGIIIPSSNITYDYTTDIDDRKRAQLLPITLPYGNPELPTLCQDKDDVIQAVRDGYAAAFDILAPIAVLPFDSRTITGSKVAKILFPDADDDDSIAVLEKPVKIRSSYIGEDEEAKRISFSTWVARKREARRRSMDEKMFSHPDGILDRQMQSGASMFHETNQSNTRGEDEVKALLAALPGFKNGRLDHLADALLTRKRQSMDNSSEEEKEDIDGVMME